MSFSGNGNIKLLREAVLNGNWNDVEVLLQNNPSLLLSMSLTPTSETALHIATSENRKIFVEKLVTHLSRDNLTLRENLALKTTSGDTALCIAAKSGFMDIAKTMIGTDHINVSDLQQSLFEAVNSGQQEMAQYLFSHPMIVFLFSRPMIAQPGYRKHISLFVATVTSEMYDMALGMLKDHRELAFHRDDTRLNPTALHVLVQKPQDIFNGCAVGTARRYILSWIYWEACKSTVAYQLLKMIWDQYQRLDKGRFVQLTCAKPNVFFEAVKSGNVKFVTLLVETFLMWNFEEVDKQLLHLAISHRQEKIFNQICRVGALKDYGTTFIDADGNCMLHLAGKLLMSENLDTSRRNLPMEREVFWFKEMQKILPPQFTKRTNHEDLTPEDVFLKEHGDLIITARTAMNGKASSYMVVSTVIMAVGIAAVLVVPGTSMGPPETLIFNKDEWYRIFVISNAVAVFSSITSTAMLLSTVTSRFVQTEYITSLRPKMMRGVTALLISLTGLVIAFIAAFFMIFNYKTVWVPYFFAALAFFPLMSILVLSYNYYKHGMWLA